VAAKPKRAGGAKARSTGASRGRSRSGGR
jgi:hypothetical protein